jgi:hypothetical protein
VTLRTNGKRVADFNTNSGKYRGERRNVKNGSDLRRVPCLTAATSAIPQPQVAHFFVTSTDTKLISNSQSSPLAYA